MASSHMRLFLIHFYTDNSNFLRLQLLALRNLKNNLLFFCEARASLEWKNFSEYLPSMKLDLISS